MCVYTIYIYTYIHTHTHTHVHANIHRCPCCFVRVFALTLFCFWQNECAVRQTESLLRMAYQVHDAHGLAPMHFVAAAGCVAHLSECILGWNFDYKVAAIWIFSGRRAEQLESWNKYRVSLNAHSQHILSSRGFLTKNGFISGLPEEGRGGLFSNSCILLE